MNKILKNEILLIDKPLNWTSNDVIRKIKKITNEKKVGHGGTLDPLATGLLVIGINGGTKKLNNLLTSTKEYYAEIQFGFSTTTYDLEGEITNKTTHIPTLNEIVQTLETLKLEYLQTPPVYSAIKINGNKAYEMARKNKEVIIEPRKVDLISYKVQEFNNNILKIHLHVSKGFYIRSLADDLGKLNNSSSCLINLRRTRVGEYEINNAIKIEEIYDYWFKH